MYDRYYNGSKNYGTYNSFPKHILDTGDKIGL